MFSFFKKSKPQTAVPNWASFFKPDEYNKFVIAVEDYFYEKNVSYTIEDGALNAAPNDFGFGVAGLVNVAQICKQDEVVNYKEIVTLHFDSLLKSQEDDKEFKKIIDDYSQVKEYIAVRLYPADYAASVGKELTIYKEFGDGVIALLVFDLPNTIESILPEQASKWGRDFEELFETGIQNIKDKYPADISQEPFGPLLIWFIQGNHFFTPNIVYDLENNPQLIGTKGSLIGIPHRHAAIIYPIETIQVVEAINALIPAINGMYIEGPGSISNNLFWYKDGQFQNLPYKIEENKIQFHPPEEFISLLNDL